MEKSLITQQIVTLDRLEENTGQLPGLPENPRYITEEKKQKLAANIEEHPELLEYRSLLVYPLPTGNYIVIGGNQRLKALHELGYTEAPCIIIDPETSVERLKALTVLDNASFGKFDMEALANMWDDEALHNFGVDIPTFDAVSLDGLFEPTQGGGSKEESAPDHIIVVLSDDLKEDKDEVMDFITDSLNERYAGCKISLKK